MNNVDRQRSMALAARRRLDSRTRRAASARACQRLARLPVFRRARRIGLYWPLASEIDPRILLSLARPEQALCLPRVVGPTLVFIRIIDRVFRHSTSPHGMIEPIGRRHTSAATLDLLVMPLAAFDSQARRIGMGGGYYDRTLAPLRDRPHTCPTLVGLGFEVQRVPVIETRPWDIDLDAIVSERGVYQKAR